jgi:GT2 family glycosyltransferase
MPRPRVSVVVPFRGGRDEAERLVRSLAALRVQPGDELIVADNSDHGAALAAVGAARPIRAVRAVGERSSYHARNAGARHAGGEWILFLDADCRPEPSLLDAFFRPPPGPATGAIAGQILAEPGQAGIAARYARSRRLFDQSEGLLPASGGVAGAGNLLVRRSAFEALGGFVEGIRSGGDVDLCQRLAPAGLDLEYRPAALVHHTHRGSLPSMLGAFARYASGARWLSDRYPGSVARWPLIPGLAGTARDVATNLARGRLEEAAFRAIDGAGLVAYRAGFLIPNSAPAARVAGAPPSA